MQSILRSPIIQLALAILCLAAINIGAHAFLPIFQSFPISGIASGNPSAPADTAFIANLYPLAATVRSGDTPPATPNDIILVDDAFIPRTAPKEIIAAKTPDYFSLLDTQKVLDLQAITTEGAIINQRFYAYDAPLAEFAYPGSHATSPQLIPTVRRAQRSNAVRISETPGARYFLLTISAD